MQSFQSVPNSVGHHIVISALYIDFPLTTQSIFHIVLICRYDMIQSIGNTSIQLSMTFNSLQRLPTQMDPFHSWTHYFHLDQTTPFSVQITENLPT